MFRLQSIIHHLSFRLTLMRWFAWHPNTSCQNPTAASSVEARQPIKGRKGGANVRLKSGHDTECSPGLVSRGREGRAAYCVAFQMQKGEMWKCFLFFLFFCPMRIFFFKFVQNIQWCLEIHVKSYFAIKMNGNAIKPFHPPSRK